MKKIFLMCSLMLGMVVASHAQGRQMASPADQAKALQTQLKLTDDQTAKVTAILQAQATKRDSIRTAANGDRDAMMQAMRPLMQDTQTKLSAVLTPEQQAAYKKIQDERRAQMQQRMNGGGGAPPSQE